MTVNAPARHTPIAARRIGYAVATAINAGLLLMINLWPGWQVLPFLTRDMDQVLGLVNLSLLAGLVANVVYVARDPAWLRALGDLVTTGIGLAAMVRVWRVFPFDFGGYSFDWTLVVRVVLVVALVGSAIGILVQVVVLVRRLFDLARPAGRGGADRG